MNDKVNDENKLMPIFRFPGYYLSENDLVYRKVGGLLKGNAKSSVSLYKNVGRSQKRQGVRESYKLMKGCRKTYTYKGIKRSRTVFLMYKNGKCHTVGLNVLISQKNLKPQGHELIGFPGYIVGKKGKVYNKHNKEMKTDSYGTVHLSKNGERFKVPRSVIDAQISGLLTKIKRISEFPDYFIDNRGIIYNRLFKPMKPLLSVDSERGYHNYIILFWDGERQHKRFLHRVIAAELLEREIDSAGIIGFKDGNRLNCSPGNIFWITLSELKERMSKSNKDRFTHTKEYAVENCCCPILKEYYETQNVEIINKIFGELDDTVFIDYWAEIKGEVYVKIMEKLSRYAMLTPVKPYIMKVMKYYKYRGLDNIKPFEEYSKTKVSRVHRLTVDSPEYASAL